MSKHLFIHRDLRTRVFPLRARRKLCRWRGDADAGRKREEPFEKNREGGMKLRGREFVLLGKPQAKGLAKEGIEMGI